MFLDVRSILSQLSLGAGGGGGGGGAASVLPIRDAAWIDPSNPAAADDGDTASPFVTIQAGINALEAAAQAASGGFPPYSSAAQMRFYTVFVTPGIYNESIAFPAGLAWRLIALGQVTLGSGDLDNLGSTTIQNVTWDADPNLEPGGAQIRPTLMITTLADGPTSSTHTGYACGFDISGSLTLTDTSGVGGTTTELHLNQVKVRGDLVLDKPGTTNCYFQHCFFDQAITNPFPGSPNIVLASECEFDGDVTINSLSRAQFCEISGDWTVSAIASFLPPNGLIACQFGIANTWTGPPASFIVDAYSNAEAIGSGVVLAGGATKIVIGDLTP